MIKVNIVGEYITLGQFLKKVDFISSGGQTRDFIIQHTIKVNGVSEDRRGRKLKPGDRIQVNETEFLLD